MEYIKYEQLVAKLYDGIISIWIIIWASIAFGWWGFFVSVLVCALEEYQNKNYKLSDWTEH